MLRWRRSESRASARAFIHRQHGSITPPLIIRQRLIERLPAGKPVIDGRRQEVGIAKGITDSLGAQRMLVITCIARQSPAGTPRIAKESRHFCLALQRLYLFAIFEKLCGPWDCL